MIAIRGNKMYHFRDQTAILHGSQKKLDDHWSLLGSHVLRDKLMLANPIEALPKTYFKTSAISNHVTTHILTWLNVYKAWQSISLHFGL